MKVCVKNYNSKTKKKDVITVDYIVIGGKYVLGKNIGR